MFSFPSVFSILSIKCTGCFQSFASLMHIWIIHDHDCISLNLFTFLTLTIWMGKHSDKNKNWPELFPFSHTEVLGNLRKSDSLYFFSTFFKSSVWNTPRKTVEYQHILKIQGKTAFIKNLKVRDSNKNQRENDKDQNE